MSKAKSEKRKAKMKAADAAGADAVRLFALSFSLFALPACTVGPDYKRPAGEPDGLYLGAATPDGVSASGIFSTPTSSGPVSPGARWWGIFNDERLTRLVEHAAFGNLMLDQARARVRQARASVIVAESGLYPTLDVGAGVTRSRSSAGFTGSTFRAGFDAAWEIDVFGGVRRQVEAAEADLEATAEDQRAAWVSVAAEVAGTYVQLRGAQSRLAFARKNLEAQRRTAGLTRERFEAGYVGGLDVANAEQQVQTTLSRIPPLETLVRQNALALGVLLGVDPRAVVEELSAEGPIPEPPGEVPVGVPSELLRRRPDIRAAERRLAARTARVGVAVSDLFPRFSLTGSLGTGGPDAADLGTLARRAWSVGPSVSWNVYDAGRTRAQIEGARAAADEALAAYRQTVLVSLQDVESALIAFTKEQARRASLTGAVAANRDAVTYARELYVAGRTDFLNVLNAERQLLESEDQLAASTTNVSASLVQLYKALGGGWEGSALTDPMPAAPAPAAPGRQ
jgi:NodT family efflux transporter outer membrane factor (OMF) lipoprotein